MNKSIKKNNPSLLIIAGLVGMGISVIFAVESTPKAMRIIEEEKKKKEEPLTKKEIVKATWKCYVPTAISFGLSMASILMANSMNKRRQEAFAAAYSIAETSLRSYQEKVKEVIGEKKEREIRDELAISKMRETPLISKEVIFTGKGETLCFDELSGRYFRSDRVELDKIFAQLNVRLRNEMYISVNEYWYAIGLSYQDIGDDLGWNIDCGYIEPLYSYGPAEDDSPCLIVGFSSRIAPRYDYRTLM